MRFITQRFLFTNLRIHQTTTLYLTIPLNDITQNRKGLVAVVDISFLGHVNVGYSFNDIEVICDMMDLCIRTNGYNFKYDTFTEFMKAVILFLQE